MSVPGKTHSDMGYRSRIPRIKQPSVGSAEDIQTQNSLSLNTEKESPSKFRPISLLEGSR